MTIKVSVGGAKEQQATKGGSPVVTNVKLKMRRAMNGDIMVRNPTCCRQRFFSNGINQCFKVDRRRATLF